ERDTWMKKYEQIELEHSILKKTLQKFTNHSSDKNGQERNDEIFMRDVSMKYKYMENQCEFLNVNLNILSLEKEKEVKKNRELQKIINKQKKEIDGYKKILEKLKSIIISFKKKKDEAESKICSMIDNNLETKNDNNLLKEIIKINDRLNDVNKKVNEQVIVELENTRNKLCIANNKIKNFFQIITNISDRYLKCKKEKDKTLLATLKINEQLTEELRKKKAIENYNIQWKVKLEEFNALNVLLNYYEVKYKVSNANRHLVLKYINSISSSSPIEGIKRGKSNGVLGSSDGSCAYNSRNNIFNLEDEKAVNSLLFHHLCNIYNTERSKQKEEVTYDEQMNLLKEKILTEYISKTNPQKENMLPISMPTMENEKKDLTTSEAFALSKLSFSNIVEILYCNMKIVNDIMDCVNMSLLLLIYIRDTYLKEIITNINDHPSYVLSLEKGSIRFGIYFSITLCNFLVCIIKYVQIIKSANRYNNIQLLQDDRLANIFCLSKYILEQFMEKIKFKLFSNNIDYSTLNMLTSMLIDMHNTLFITHVQLDKPDDRKMEEKSYQSKRHAIYEKERYKMTTKIYSNHEMDENGEIDHIYYIEKNNQMNDKEKEIKSKDVREMNTNETVSSFEMFCFLNTASAVSILLIIDKDTYVHFSNEVDLNIQMEIIIKCEEVLKLIKTPQKILNFHFMTKQYKISFKNFIRYTEKYKEVLINNISNTNNEKWGKELSSTISKTSNYILKELKTILESSNIYSIDIQEKKKLFIFKIFEKYIEIYNNVMSKKNKRIIEPKDLEEKEGVIKKLEEKVMSCTNTIQMLEKNINILTIREEKFNKIKMDFDILKKEKNEYLSIITDLRKSKNESLNEITYISKNYNELKNKYNELLKNYEQKKKYIGSTKNFEQSNLDIYYMKRIINNLYYENFLTKINKHYYLFDQKINYYNDLYLDSLAINFNHSLENENPPKETNEINSNEVDSPNNTREIKNEKKKKKITLNENQLLQDNNTFFSNTKHSMLYDDIYNCEIIKSKLKRCKTDYFKNKLYQTTLSSSFIPRENNKSIQHIVDIIESYKILKNDIFTQILNTPIGSINDQTNTGSSSKGHSQKCAQKLAQERAHVYSKLKSLKSVVNNFYTTNKLAKFNDAVSLQDSMLRISIQGKKEADERVVAGREAQRGDVVANVEARNGGDDSSNRTKDGRIPFEHVTTLPSCNKIILNENSFSYLIQNVFNL
ncbi:conserved Plasmodium protein, unknown function, partial [Plasmodium malariae]